MPTITFSNKPPKPLEKWSSRDFIIYYSNSLKKLTGENLKVPPEAWVGFGARIKGFQRKLNLTNIEYKNFIDEVFSSFYVKNKYQPSFGSIVSEKIYYLVNKNRDSNEFSNTDFENLRKELYKDSTLFKNLRLDLND
jgi:hypothetical protein